jgi:hypothetical protein
MSPSLSRYTVGIVGLAMGTVTGLGGLVGTIAGGILGDRLSKDDPRGYLTVPFFCALLQPPFIAGALLCADVRLSFALFAVPAILAGAYLSPLLALLMGLVRPDQRGTAGALLTTTATLVGLGLGPYLIGVLSDAFAGALGGSAEGIRWALLTASISTLFAASLFALARRYVRDDYLG